MASKRVTRSQSAARCLSAASSTTLSDLGPDLLNSIFCKLAPSPMHLAAVSCVCKNWRNVMEEETWKQLCLAAAPALCKAMGFNEPGVPWGLAWDLQTLGLLSGAASFLSLGRCSCSGLWRRTEWLVGVAGTCADFRVRISNRACCD
jgi:hypothetical protein